MNKSKIILRVLCVLYNTVLRDILVKAVTNTDNDLDDQIVKVLDVLLDVEGPDA